MYDLIIIGAGPAGITASVYAARKQMNFLVVSQDIGGQTAWSGEIENYTGYQFVSGPELTSKFEEHMKKYNVPVKLNEKVTELYKEDEKIKVISNKDSYQARAVVIASGKKSKELGVPGEKEFKNKGLTYCATCDGPLFSEKDVVVVGGGNSALDAALQLLKIAKKIYIVDVSPELGGDAIMREKVLASKKVEVLSNSEVKSIEGDKFVKSVKIKTNEEEKELQAEGVFVEIGLEPNSDFTKDIDKNKKGEIIVNCNSETNIPGIYAAGDVTDVPEKQIIIAAGDGAKAALGAFRFLSKSSYKDINW